MRDVAGSNKKGNAMIDLCFEEERRHGFGGVTLRVIGIGGAGSNAVNSMIDSKEMEAVDFLVANTDAQSLNLSTASGKIQLGSKITKGLGAGSNPDIGRRAAEEDLDAIIEKIKGTDILFLTGGLGGGTGSGALPVIASVAKEMGVLTVAIVTKPFTFEGKRRKDIADNAIASLSQAVDTMIVVPNQRLLEIVDAKISMLDAFSLSNDILKQAIKGISDIITRSGHINVDFADVKTIMKDMGMALMGTGRARGEDRAKQAAAKAISSPLLENVSIKGAKGVLINITGNTDLGLYEINEAASLVYELVSPEANIILGSVIDPAMGDEIMITVIATGFDVQTKQQQEPTKIEVRLERQERHVLPVQQIKEVKQELDLEESMKVVPSRAHDLHENDDLDTPTFLRKKSLVERIEAPKNNNQHSYVAAREEYQEEAREVHQKSQPFQE